MQLFTVDLDPNKIVQTGLLQRIEAIGPLGQLNGPVSNAFAETGEGGKGARLIFVSLVSREKSDQERDAFATAQGK